MVEDNSGFIFRFPLHFNLGYGYAEILDFSDISNFGGTIANVFDYFDLDTDFDKNMIDVITKTSYYLGPIYLNKYPNVKGKNSWKLIGKNEGFTKDFPPIKSYAGNKLKYDWSILSPWYLIRGSGLDAVYEEMEYEKLRYNETGILTHKDSLPAKVTMRKLIDSGLKVSEYYDFRDLGNRNLYVQVINTYYPKEKTDELILDLPEFSYSSI